MSSSPCLEGLQRRLEHHGQVFGSVLQLIPSKYTATPTNGVPQMSKYMRHTKNNNSKYRQRLERKLDGQQVQDTESVDSRDGSEATMETESSLDHAPSDPVAGDLDAEPEGATSPSISALKARLQARITQLRSTRHAEKHDTKRKRSEESIKEKRQKRKRESREQQAKAKTSITVPAGGTMSVLNANDHADDLPVAKSAHTPNGNTAPVLPVVEEAVDYGKLEFMASDDDTTTLSAHISKPKKNKKSAVQALREAEAKKQALEALANEDQEAYKAAKEKDAWNRAMELAEGNKVRDNIKLLKKTVKRTQAKKRKSENEWKEREKQVAMDKAKRQKQRNENLKARANGKKDPKGGKKAAKPKQRPGFEGTARFAKKARSKK
ncbi:hypothetical protein H4R34_002940 [Dimargaris verticillata]|uniref:Ribosomal RNA-processing protein 14/surfeit locus protein 6 C-terminal domain-containing protein n=1 Tax=Dimargaris verticillata TaxID=2761393 RepID=A0A9W8B766_9FUNG|nr:hypothetical protein H4R34_002940 [Dimargaris verticillata]